jgi:hypothetical protein
MQPNYVTLQDREAASLAVVVSMTAFHVSGHIFIILEIAIR